MTLRGPEWNPVLLVLAVLAVLCVLATLRWWLGVTLLVAVLVALVVAYVREGPA